MELGIAVILGNLSFDGSARYVMLGGREASVTVTVTESESGKLARSENEGFVMYYRPEAPQGLEFELFGSWCFRSTGITGCTVRGAVLRFGELAHLEYVSIRS